MTKLYIQLRAMGLAVLDKITRKRGMSITINNQRLKVPGRFLKYFSREYEKENFSFLQEWMHPGMTCIDIGGHIGIYSAYMAKLKAAQVFSFEPTPSSYRLLQKTIALNSYQHIIHPLQIAVSDTSGKSTFYLNKSIKKNYETTRIAETNSLLPVDFGDEIIKEKIDITTCSIDDFTAVYKLTIDFLKIDAEGSELEILKGAKKTMQHDRPAGIIGIHRFAYPDENKTLTEIWDIFEEYKIQPMYHNQEINRHQFMTIQEKGLLDIQFYPIERKKTNT